MKFTKPFHGCKAGEIYPTQFETGDECPPELLAAAEAMGAIDAGTKGKAKAAPMPPEEAKGDGNSDT